MEGSSWESIEMQKGDCDNHMMPKVGYWALQVCHRVEGESGMSSWGLPYPAPQKAPKMLFRGLQDAFLASYRLA